MVVNLDAKFAKISDHWSPKIVGQVNNFHVKAVKIQGEFIWHSHPETDELFWVHDGELCMEFRDKKQVVRAGEFLVVPRGMEHRPVAEKECLLILIEPEGTLNTGDATGVEPANPHWI